jgi:hypothetical protein
MPGGRNWNTEKVDWRQFPGRKAEHRIRLLPRPVRPHSNPLLLLDSFPVTAGPKI